MLYFHPGPANGLWPNWLHFPQLCQIPISSMRTSLGWISTHRRKSRKVSSLHFLYFLRMFDSGHLNSDSPASASAVRAAGAGAALPERNKVFPDIFFFSGKPFSAKIHHKFMYMSRMKILRQSYFLSICLFFCFPFPNGNAPTQQMHKEESVIGAERR